MGLALVELLVVKVPVEYDGVLREYVYSTYD
jgi:hypothetical protein